MAVGLSISNATPRKLPGPQLLHDLVPRHSKNDVPAIDHTTEDGSSIKLTYAEFHDKADALSHCILSTIKHSAAKRKRLIVPVLIPQGPDLYISQLAILKAGGAFCPIVLDAPEERLRFILKDVDACVLLTTAASRHHLLETPGIEVISVDEIPQDFPAKTIDRPVVPEDPAYIMYTSGSTGQPKGVVLSHSAATQALLAHDSHIPRFQRFLQFASPTFDVSVFEIFFPWLRETTLVSCDRRRMLNDLTAVINDLGVDACELTPSVASSLLRGRKSVPSLKVLLTIGEMLKPSLVEEFGGDDAQRAMLQGMYGPTEATIHCTLQTNFPKSLACGSIGIPLDTVSAFIVRPVEENGGKHIPIPEILPLGEEGELAVGGHQLADGYLNRDEQTKAAFVRHPRHGILYRTGDRARMLPNGTFECLGRISTGQVKLRGQRIELGEIEHAVFKTPGCQDVVVEVIGGILVAFCVSVDGSLTASNIFHTCREWLPAFMVPGDIVILDTLPYLASGKCDRKALRAHYEARQTSDPSSAHTDVPYVQEVLSAIEAVLGVSAQPKSSLPGLGLDSISSIRIASELKRQGLAQLDAGRLLAARTPLDVCSLIQAIDDARSEYSRLQETERSYKPAMETQLREVLSATDLSAVAEAFPCTSTQTAMLAETSKNSKAYCNWVEFLLPDLQDCAAVRYALHTLSEEHCLLRSGFLAVSGSSWSYINVIWNSLAGFQVKEVSNFDYNFRIESDADLLRPLGFQLLRDVKGCRLLLLAHHALYDQWAIDIFRKDLSALLSGKSDIKARPFKAVSDHQLAFEKLDTGSVTLDFWQEHLRDVATTALPALRGQHKEHGLKRTSWRQTTARTSEMRKKALDLNCSTPAIFQAALALLLGAYTGTADVVFGTVLSGRTIPVQGIDTVFGPCLATLPSRIDLSTTRTNADLLSAMTSSSRAMQDNMLISTTAIRQAAGIAPGSTLFDTLFVWQETTLDLQEVAGRVALIDSQDQLEFKLVLEFEPTSTDIRIRATYDQSLIDAHQADLVVDQVAQVALAVVENPEYAVADISTLLPASLMSISNPKPVSYGNTFELTAVIDQRAIEHPEATAILFATDLEASPLVADSISYADLVARANRMARHFAAEGLQPQGIAVICMEKSIDLYVAMLASFKCGAGYLPLVPETPAARIKSILAQGNVHLCVCDAETAPSFLNIDNIRTVDITTANLPEESYSLQVEQAGFRVSYAVFTSGSTGQPKGVAVTMDNLKGNLAVLSELYKVSPGDRLLQSCSQAFDVSVFEIFFAFYSGMCLCSATKEVMFRDFEQSIHGFQATHLSLTPTVATLAKPSNVPSVKFLVTAGEGITEKLHKTWAGHGLHQGYGPSETTNICSIKMDVSPTDVLGNIGPPFRNTSAFVIAPGHDFRILPAGAYGEFAFGGEQVFRGYMGRDDLNAEKIITHPMYGRIYRSGDMGRILSDGTLLISGRLDDQVKIRGNRVELGEINALLSNHSAVADCTTILLGEKSSTQMLATFWVPASVQSGPSERCVLASSATDLTPILFGLLESSLPAYMIPSILVPLTKLPVTAQGKLDKRTLREIPGELGSNIKNTLSRSQDTPDDDPPSTPTEQALASALSSLLEIEISSISRSISFFSLGLNSLNAIQYAKAIEKKLSTRLSVSNILRHPSVARLAPLVSEHTGNESSVTPVNVRAVFGENVIKEIRKSYAEKGLRVEAILPCTPLQESMLSAGLAQDSSAYCNTTRINVGGNMEMIEKCWHTLTSRHAILRTSFVETATAEHPFAQVVLQNRPVPWHSRRRASSSSAPHGYTNGSTNGHVKHHNTQSPSPKQVSARDPIRIDEDGAVLCIQMHHALYDGISMANVLGEMHSLYQGHSLPPPISFEPFLEQVLAQNSTDAADYWSSQVSDFAARPFPTICSHDVRPEETYERTLALSPKELELFSERHACTSLAVLQAAWTKTLACAQAVSDICFGNVVSGRSVPVQDVDQLVAPCFNTMPLRIRLDLHRTNLDLIRGLHHLNVKCSPFQLTAPRRIQALSATPSTPLFDTLLLLQPPQSDELPWDIEEDEMDMGIPLVMEATPNEDRFELQVHYLPAKVPDELVPVIVDAFAASLAACMRYSSSSIDHLGEFNMAELAAKLAIAETSSVEHEADISQDSDHVPWTDEERLIREAFAGLAGLDLSRITKHTSLYQIGLDSLNAVQIASRLRKDGLRVNAADVMQYATPSTLAKYLTTSNIDSHEQSSGVDLAAFEARHRDHLVRSLRLQNDRLEAIRPCTPVQSGMLAQFIQSQGSHYFNHNTFEIPNGVDVAHIRTAWTEVQKRHQVLRMGFAQLDNAEQPFAMLIYRPGSYLETIFLNSEEISTADLEKTTSEQVLQSLHVPAWRLSLSSSADGRQMCVSLHHALYDADSLSILFSDFAKALNGVKLGPPLDLDTLLKAQLEGSVQVKTKSEDFWKTTLQSSHLVRFPNLTPTIVEESRARSSELNLTLDAEELDRFCRNQGVTIQALGQSVWALLLAAYFGEVDVTFGTVFAGASTSSSRQIAFPSISTLPVYCNTDKEPIAVIKDMVSYNASAQRYRFSSLSDIQRFAGSAGHALFDTIFVYQKTPDSDVTTFEWKPIRNELGIDYAISLELEHVDDGKLRLRLTHETRTVPDSHASLILQQYNMLIQRIVRNDKADGDGSAALMSTVSAKQATIPCAADLLHEFVERGARMHPDKVALEFIYDLRGTHNSRKTWTYRDLDRRSNQIAQVICQRGIRPDSTIAVCMTKCPEATFAFVGILKAGCAFLAMDPDLPLARRQFIAEDSRSQLLFVNQGQPSEDMERAVPVVELSEDTLVSYPETSPGISSIHAQSTSYCLYTSGTTGNPKGCELSHENAVQAMMSFQRLFANHWTESSRWLQFASYWFDVSVLEQFWSWSVGITVVGAPRDVVLEDLPAFIRAAKITHIDLTPSLARLLKPEDVPSLHGHVFITGGEALKQEIIDAWGPLHTIYNGYGPTEATIGVTMNPHIGLDAKPSNIGPPFDNVGAYVFKPGTDEVVMRGAVGELCVSGKLVGKGYLNRPDLTAKAFPFLEKYGEKVYRTGDLVRLLADDSVCFIGRQDTQAKLRGQRLEIDEIDAVIKQSTADIADVASLVVKSDEGAREMLVSFLVVSDARSRDLKIVDLPPTGELVSTADRACRDHLPGYMVPTHMIPVTRIPLTVNNKVDTKRLISLFSSLSTKDLQKLKGNTSADRKLRPAERKVAKILAQLLSIDTDDILPASNIYSLGLSSVSAINFTSMLKRSGFRNASVATVMNNQNVDGLATALTEDTDASREERSAVLQAQLSISAFAQRHRSTAAKAMNINVADIESLAPCTPLQEGLLIASLKTAQRSYFNHFLYELHAVDLHKLEKAIKGTYQLLSILRTSFVDTDDGFGQVVLRKRRCPLEMVEIEIDDIELYLSERRNEWSDRATQDVREPLQMLIVQGRQGRFLSIFVHHALYDGISWELVMDRLADTYTGVSEVDCGPDFHEAIAYGPLCRRKDAKMFWQTRMQDFHYSPLPILCDKPLERDIHVRKALPRIEKLETVRKDIGVSHQAMLQAAFTVALHQVASHTQSYGVVLSGRSVPRDRAAQVIGPMFNTVPFAIDVQSTDTWIQYIQRCHEANSTCLAFQHTPLRDIRKHCGRNPADPMFDVLFVFQRPETSESAAHDLFQVVDTEVAAEYPLAFEVELDPSGMLSVTLAARGGFATESTLLHLVETFEKALSALSADAGQVINDKFNISRDSVSSTPTRGQDMTMLDGVIDFEWTQDALKLRSIIAQVVGCDEDSIDEHMAIYTLGLDSIDAVKLASRMKRAGLAVPVSKLLKAQTIPRILGVLETKDAAFSSKSQSKLKTLEQQLRGSWPLNSEAIEKIVPAAPGQEALVADMVRSDFRDYYNSDILKLRKDLDLTKLMDAWQMVVDASSILRTSFLEIEDPEIDITYAQVIHKPARIRFDRFEASSLGDLDKYIERVRSDVQKTFTTTPPLRLAVATVSESNYLILSLAHAQYDGHSLALLHEDISKAYEGSYTARPSYEEVIEVALDSTSDESTAFWRNALAGTKPTAFTNAGAISGSTTYHAERASAVPAIDARKACKQIGVSLQALAQSAWALLLAHYEHELEVTFGVVLACRESEEAEQVLFPTMNTVPIRASLHGTSQELLQHVQGTINEIRPFQRTPLRSIQAACATVVDSSKSNMNGLFDTLFVYQNRGDSGPNSQALYESVGGDANVDYHVAVEVEAIDDALMIRASCKAYALDEKATDTLVKRFDHVLSHLVGNPDESIADFTDDGVSICGLPPFPLQMESLSRQTTREVDIIDGSDEESDMESAVADSIRSALAQVSKLDLQEVSSTTSLESIGIDSISAIKVAAILRKESIKLSVSDILKAQTPKRMAAIIDVGSTSSQAKDTCPDDTISTALQGIDIGALCRGTGMEERNVEAILPATAGQEYMLSMWQKSSGELFYPTFRYHVKTHHSKGRIHDAWQELLQRSPILRTAMVYQPDLEPSLLQVVLKAVPERSSKAPLHPMAALSITETTEGLDLALRIHHALYDAVSLQLLIDQLKDLVNARDVPLPTVTFKKFVAASCNIDAKQSRQQFWQRYLADSTPPQLSQPRDDATRKVQMFRPAAFGSGEKLERHARAKGVTVQALLFAVYAKAYASQSQTQRDGSEDIVIGIYLANRTHLAELDQLAAPTLNLLPLRVRSPRKTSLVEVAKQIDADIKEIGSIENSSASLSEIYEWTGVRVDTFVNFLKLPEHAEDTPATGIDEVKITQQDDEWTSEISRVINPELSQDFQMPLGLEEFKAGEAYLHAVDVEVSMSSDGKMSIGLFAKEDMVGLKEGEEMVNEIVDGLEKAFKEE
ncbi:Nonribosomal peptide synthase sidC [Pseudocercospora fuligena]|uniref:Nonribosomal peptide synthase sidC n=1 Tax=Pseudocercospora fuligena TaxID=685502 RepID=A0A8H6VG71_9PEZI|nr:Nonribosomal peptide synthase sidC [Pseudocercospora fuligena]